MKKSDSLFQLIKSLSKSEKGYFKKYSALHIIGEKNNYMKLFEALDKQKEYDEKALHLLLHKEPFMKYLSASKYYLEKLILKSLHVYHSNTSIDSQIEELLHCVEILFDKNLHEKCKKLLEKAKQITYDYERFQYIIKITRLDIEISRKFRRLKKEQKYISTIYEKESAVLEKIKNTHEYRKLKDIVFSLYKRKGPARKTNELVQIKKVMQNPLLRNEKQALSYDAKFYFYITHIFFCDITGNAEGYNKFCKKNLELIESNPDRKKKGLKGYIAILNNLLRSCSSLNKNDEFHYYLDKLKNVQETIPSQALTASIQVKIFEYLYIHETNFYLRNKEYKKGLAIIPKLEEGIKMYSGIMDKIFELNLYNNIVFLFLGAGQYSKAIPWLNKILDYEKTEVREDFILNAKICSLIVHYELKNWELLESIVKSTYRYLYKKNKTYKFETLILNFIKKISKADGQVELKNAFRELKNEIILLSKEPLERKSFEDFDTISWLNNKINTKIG